MVEGVLKVALPVPLPGLFDYLPPAGGCEVRAGCRVRVPFGRRELTGVVIATAAEAAHPRERLKPVATVLDAEPLLAADDLAFLRWAAAYYHHPVGEVICNGLPLRLRKGQPPLSLAGTGWCLAQAANAAAPDLLARAPRQQALLQLVRDAGGSIADRELRQLFERPAQPLRALVDKGLLECCTLAPPDPVLRPGPHRPHAEQQAAIDSVAATLDRFGVTLLDGVTGSGKTEVYLQLAGRVLAAGRSVLILVPEISLTPQLLQRFVARFGRTAAMLHSGLADGERETAWQEARLGWRRVLLGTRSSVFVPLPDLGLVVVDEEHDSSFKQQDGFRYSARDLAIVRARRAACPVLLGSATPSLETLRNAALGRYTHCRLVQRAGGASAPGMQLLDVRGENLHAGMSPRLLRDLAETVERGEQAILFINRRGYAPVLSCYSCGWLSECPHCDARQTLHRRADRLLCHHCGASQRVPQRCPECGAADLHPLGQGTERLEEYLGTHFPDTPLLRIDRDTTRTRDSLEHKLARVQESGAAILVGTQMLAKGHHFPRVTLVGIVDVDGGLFSADFRAGEHMAQLIVQVGGRAGRAERPGRVVLQTRYPDHPLLQTLVHHGYPGFAREAMEERRGAALPPFSHQALLRADARVPGQAEEFLAEVVAWLDEHTAEPVHIWGPVPAPMQRRAGMLRAQLLLQADAREPLHRLLARVEPVLPGLPAARRVRWSLDVDPVDLY